MPLTKAQKESIREALQQGQKASFVATRFSVSRARVHQLRKEDPATWSKDAVTSRAKKTEYLCFRKANAHLNDAVLQRAISSSPNSFPWLAEQHGTSLYAITRIHHHWNGPIKTGRPAGRGRGKPKPPLTPEQLREKRLRAAAATSRWQKRWRRLNPELARQKNHAAYERRKDRHNAAARAYYHEHRAEMLQRNREWKKAHPERIAEHKRRSAARQKQRRATLAT